MCSLFAERDVEVAPDELAAEVPAGTRSLYWFSQTIGPNRGLEDAVRALPLLPDDVVLSLRGGWAHGYEHDLRSLAASLGVDYRLRALPHCRPDEVIRRAAEHDVGLALEPGNRQNNDLAVSNKLFTYLLAGIPAVVTETVGQQGICEGLPDATRLYKVGNVGELGRSLLSLLEDPEAKVAAQNAAQHRYNWDTEKLKLIREINNLF